MSSIATLGYGTLATPSWTSLNSLGAGSTSLSPAINNTAGADDFIAEVTIAGIVGGAAGNKQILFYALASLDGSVYGDSNNLTNYRRLGFLDVTAGSSWVFSGASVAAAFGGICPQYFKLAAFNDAGGSLNSSGHSVRLQPITYLAT